MKNLKVIVVLAAVIALLAVSGCRAFRPAARVGELQTRTESIKLDGAKSENVEIDMGAGDLNVSGGASKNELLQGKFTYNVAELDPQVSYRGGQLSVRTPNVSTGPASLWDIDEYRYEWDLQLNEDVPMQMRVHVGVGSAILNLGGLSLTSLDLEAGAAPVTVDLTGDWQDDLDATIDGGLGRFTLRLPSSACVRIGIDGGIGNIDAQGLEWDGDYYVNTACDKSGVTLRININPGVGGVDLVEVG